MNEALGNVGTTVVYTEPVEAAAGRSARSRCASWSPTWTPARSTCSSSSAATRSTPRRPTSTFADGARARCRLRVHLGLYDDETVGAAATGRSPRRTTSKPGATRARYDGTVVDRAAADRAALRRQVGARAARALLERPAGARRLRHRPRVLDARAPTPARDFEAFWRRCAARRRHRRTPRCRRDRRRCAALGERRQRAGRRRAAGGLEIVLPARPDDLRRPLRQQRLAPGAAQAAHQADLGQRRHRQPGDRRAAQAGTRRRAGRRARPDRSDVVELRYQRPHGRGAGVRVARPARRLRHRAPRLRPHARRPASATAPASTPTRSARSTRCGSAAALEVAPTGDDAIRSPARSTTT